MTPDDVKRKDPKTGSRLNLLAFFLLLVAVGAVVFLVYLKSHNLELKDISWNMLFGTSAVTAGPASTVDRELEIPYETKDHPSFILYQGMIVKCTRDSLKFINLKGQEVKSISLSMNNPVLKTGGKDLLVADIGGRGLLVVKDSEIKWQVRLENTLLNADISDKGYVAVVHEKKGFKAATSVYDDDGNWRFSRDMAENHVISAQVAPSGEYLLINSINTSGVTADTNLEYISMDSGEPVGEAVLKDEIVPSIYFMQDDSAVAVGNSAVTCLDKERSIRWKKEYEMIFGVARVSQRYIAIAGIGREKGSAGGELQSDTRVYNAQGEEVSNCLLDGETKGMEGDDGDFTVNTGREVHFLDARGTTHGKYSSKSDILAAFPGSGGKGVVITKTAILVVNPG